jgi:hypothetical protein
LGCLFLFWLGYVGTVMECFSRLRLSRRFPEKPNEPDESHGIAPFESETDKFLVSIVGRYDL